MGGSDDDGLERAVRERDRMLARMTFWEHWRGALMLPLIATGGGIGLGLGYALETALRWPDRTRFFGAVIGILVVGRVVTSYFDASKLEVARRRVDHLKGRRISRG
jgi:hypothetical protein